MAIGQDRVQVTKVESSALGGSDGEDGPYGEPAPINPQEDAIECAGIYLQDADNRDETVAVYRDGDDLTFSDAAHAAATLSELVRRRRLLISEDEQPTTQTSWQIAASDSGSVPRAGTYEIAWYAEIKISGGAGDAVQARLGIDGEEQGQTAWFYDAYHAFSGLCYLVLEAAASPVIAVQFRRYGSAGDTAYIQRIRVSIRRVETSS